MKLKILLFNLVCSLSYSAPLPANLGTACITSSAKDVTVENETDLDGRTVLVIRKVVAGRAGFSLSSYPKGSPEKCQVWWTSSDRDTGSLEQFRDEARRFPQAKQQWWPRAIGWWKSKADGEEYLLFLKDYMSDHSSGTDLFAASPGKPTAEIGLEWSGAGEERTASEPSPLSCEVNSPIAKFGEITLKCVPNTAARSKGPVTLVTFCWKRSQFEQCRKESKK